MTGRAPPDDAPSKAIKAPLALVNGRASADDATVPTARQPAAALPVTKPLSASWFLIGSAIASVAALVWYFGAALIFGPLISVAPIARADLVQTLVASGHVETPFRISISSQIIGVVAAIPVAEGQQVKAGDRLIQLDDHEAKASVVLAQGQLCLLYTSDAADE